MPTNIEWRKVKDYPYAVSNAGDIMRLTYSANNRRYKPGDRLTPMILKSGYAFVTLSNKKGKRSKFPHRLVVESFIGEIPKGMCVNHMDGNKLNNFAHNLEITTPSENTKHAWRMGLVSIPRGEQKGHSKLTDKDVIEIRERYDNGEKIAKIAKDYPVHYENVRLIAYRKAWRHI